VFGGTLNLIQPNPRPVIHRTVSLQVQVNKQSLSIYKNSGHESFQALDFAVLLSTNHASKQANLMNIITVHKGLYQPLIYAQHMHNNQGHIFTEKANL